VHAQRHARHYPAAHGKAVQVEPIKSTLKAPGSKHLRLAHDKLPLNFAFNFNLRRYIMASPSALAVFPLQDLLALAQEYAERPANEETINDPTNPRQGSD
jgi:hypothetical protein